MKTPHAALVREKAKRQERNLLDSAMRLYLDDDQSGLRCDGKYLVLASSKGPFAVYRVVDSRYGFERFRRLKRWPKEIAA